MTTIYLTRHGQTIWNIDKRLQGVSNSDLTQLGIEQAMSLRDRMNDIDIDVIYTSPLVRALETAKIIRGNRDIEIVIEDGLKEISFGEYEGSTEAELLKKGIGTELKKMFDGDINIKTPGGESVKELYERLEYTLEKIIEKYKNKRILIVSHGMTLRTMMNYFYQGREVFTDIMGQATLTKITFDKNQFNVDILNDGSHINNNQKKKGW